MKKMIKKISAIAVMTLAILSVFAFKPSLLSDAPGCADFTLTAFAEGEDVGGDSGGDGGSSDGGSSDGGSGGGEGDSAFTNVVSFFAKWLGKVGALVAFVGGIMFALAIKNNDAEQKQNGLLTLVAGFAVVAICNAKNLFGL